MMLLIAPIIATTMIMPLLPYLKEGYGDSMFSINGKAPLKLYKITLQSWRTNKSYTFPYYQGIRILRKHKLFWQYDIIPPVTKKSRLYHLRIAIMGEKY